MGKDYIKKELTIGDLQHQGYFTEFELKKNNLLFCDLLFYINSYYHQDLDPKYIYNRLLLVFNKILKFFFRAPLKLTDWRKGSIKSSLAEYLLFRRALAGNGLEVPSDINKQNYLRLIIDLYRDLDSLGRGVQAVKTEHRLRIKDFDGSKPPFNGSDYSTIRFLQGQLKKRLSEQIDFFLIQGSYATADFVKDWSDLDTHVILNKDIFNDIKELEYTQKELQKLSLLCYKINPLAHHTFFIFPDLALKHHLNIFLPIPVLENSLAFFKKNDLILRHSESRLESLNDLWSSLAHFRKKVAESNYSQNLLDWENDLSGIMSMPTLAVQACGEPMYKKDSFEKIKNIFPDLDLNLIDWASKKRRDWKLFNALKFYPNAMFNSLPAGFNNYLINKYRFYLLRFKKITNFQEVEDFTKKALNLYETVFYRCLKWH